VEFVDLVKSFLILIPASRERTAFFSQKMCFQLLISSKQIRIFAKQRYILIDNLRSDICAKVRIVYISARAFK
jgi:hypothetical protein